MVPAPERTRDGATPRVVSVILLPRARGGPVSRSIGDALGQRGVDVRVLGPAVHPRVDHLDVPVRAHPADVLEAALSMAGGDWFAFLEAGDRWHPDHVVATIDLAEAAGASWGHGAAALLDAGGDVVGLRDAAVGADLAARLRYANVIGGASSVVCRRDVLLARRPFDRRLTALVMWAAWIALAEVPSAACAATLVAERYDDDRPVLDARAAIRDAQLLRSEGLVDRGDTPLIDLAGRFEELGHRRDATRLLLRAAALTRDPRAAARAARALRSRGRVRSAVEAPAWLKP